MSVPIRKAFVDKLLPDPTLIGLWGPLRIIATRPPVKADFPVTTLRVVIETEDYEVPRYDTIVQLDHWSRSADTNDAIADRCRALCVLPMATAGRRIQEILPELRQPLYEEDTEIYHLVQQFRVISFPA